jgi:hypothetical protein
MKRFTEFFNKIFNFDYLIAFLDKSVYEILYGVFWDFVKRLAEFFTKIYSVDYWIGFRDKSVYEVLWDFGLVKDPDYTPPTKEEKAKEEEEYRLMVATYQMNLAKWTLLNNTQLRYLDLIFLIKAFLRYPLDKTIPFLNNRGFLRRSQLSNRYLYNSSDASKYKNYLESYKKGWTSFFSAARYWFIVIIFMASIVYYCVVIRVLPFGKIVFQWFMVIMFFYWLISGFVFFVKKYQYRYFTSSIQRFWRRCFAIFWLLEAYLFMWYIYLTLNANQEPVFMYDNIQVYKTHLFSWKLFLLKLFPLTLLIIFTYFLILSLKWNTFSKTNYLCLVITVLLFYVVWMEFYQFFHVISFYGNLTWVYDIEEHLWNLESEWRRTRVSNHFVSICFMAKFWHIVFVFIFWLFFIFRGLEVSRLHYPLLSANFQNFTIIYVLGWVYMYPWLKYAVKKFFEMPYFWFYVNNRRLLVYIFFNDLKLFYYNIFNTLVGNIYNLFNNNKFKAPNFYYWNESSIFTGYTQYRKNFIRDLFIQTLQNF